MDKGGLHRTKLEDAPGLDAEDTKRWCGMEGGGLYLPEDSDALAEHPVLRKPGEDDADGGRWLAHREHGDALRGLLVLRTPGEDEAGWRKVVGT